MQEWVGRWKEGGRGELRKKMHESCQLEGRDVQYMGVYIHPGSRAGGDGETEVPTEKARTPDFSDA